jgi:FKBP12-rapamycin complex-associated protein
MATQKLFSSIQLSGGTCEALISINHQLDLPEAAAGILHYAQNVYHIELKESWYEKLQRWETALQIYEAKQVSKLFTKIIIFIFS